MLKKLKSLFIIEEETGGLDQSQAETVKEEKAKTTKVPNPPVKNNVAAPDKFINSLLKAIENNNLEGFDYLEYKQSLQSLKNMEMDESTRFNSAYAMAKTMGASKKNLLESANHYVSILNDEKSKFNVAYQKQQEKQVIQREEKLKSIKTAMEKKELQIKKLQEEINKSKKEFEKQKMEINNAATKVALTRDQFFAAHKKVFEQISSDIERMNKYLAK